MEFGALRDPHVKREKKLIRVRDVGITVKHDDILQIEAASTVGCMCRWNGPEPLCGSALIRSRPVPWA